MAGTGSKKILLVDDDRVVREAYAELLENSGYAVETAIHGIDALEKLNDAVFDLIILDINMPRLDGIDLYRRAVIYHPYLNGKFLFITGDLSGELEALSVFMQIDKKILKKPFRKEELLKNVEQLIQST